MAVKKTKTTKNFAGGSLDTKPTLRQSLGEGEEISEIYLEQVSLNIEQRDPVLTEVEVVLPTDELVVVESENPTHASLFLQLLAGRATPSKGQMLWNQKNFFADDSALEPHGLLGSYFETFKSPGDLTFRQLWRKFVDSNAELDELIAAFDLQEVCDIEFKKTPYAFQKLSQLVLPVLKRPQILVLEDPAYGLSEDQWLNYLDFIQYYQRRGFLRHLFLTNSHPTALVHLNHQKLYIADGLIYFDQKAGFKKVSHF